MLAGREPILEAFSVVRRKVDELGEGDRGWILNGLRGVGKTVLLNELLAQVTAKGWIAAKVEVTPAIPLPVALSSALVRAMRAATGRHPEPRLRRLLGVFKAFSLKFDPASGMVSVGVDVEPVAGVADTGRFADDLAMLFDVLGETSRDLGIGTLILVDELQEASAGRPHRRQHCGASDRSVRHTASGHLRWRRTAFIASAVGRCHQLRRAAL